ncbi:MAG: site-2 protease family protein, partial [Hyphomonadaceae bacterium]|nr:site-2 protease family protein [Clostridia bacterium]
ASDDDSAFCNKSVWGRIAVAAAGAIMNIILGLLFFCLLVQLTPVIKKNVIQTVLPNTPALSAGLQVGDRITKLNKSTIHTRMDAIYAMAFYKKEQGAVEVQYVRGNQTNTAQIVPMWSDEAKRFLVGIEWQDEQKTFLNVLRYGYYETATTVHLVFYTLKGLFTGEIPLNQLSSVVGVGQVVGSTVKEIPADPWGGLRGLIYLAAMISINLGIFNLLPIPALDGARIFFLLIEAVRRKPIPPEKEGKIHAVGFAFLILLMIFALFNDVFRIFTTKG